MKLILTHEGLTRELDLGTLKMRESIECQNLTGLTAPEWIEELTQNRAEAVTFAWYLAAKRHGDDVTYSHLLDTLDQMKLGVELAGDEEPADKPAAAGIDGDEGPTSPAETAGTKGRKKTPSKSGDQSSDTSTE